MALKRQKRRGLVVLSIASALTLMSLGTVQASDDDDKHDKHDPRKANDIEAVCDMGGDKARSWQDQGECLQETPDAEWVMSAMSGNATEVLLGQMALDRSTNADVKAFAQRMIQDHSQALEESITLATMVGVEPIRAPVEENHVTLVQYLSQFRGDEFDRQYIGNMVLDHRADIAEFQQEAMEGQKELASWAYSQVPTLQAHLAMASDVGQKVSAPMLPDNPEQALATSGQSMP
jgi:putative membrane protein